MKKTKTGNPTIRSIDGIPFVRVVDLAHLWDTSTSSILATDKLYSIPEEHIRCIDGSVWCSFDGLRYRLKATSRRGRLTVCIRKFLKQQEKAGAEKKQTRPVTSEPKPTAATPTDLGTAALIADARRTASQALAKAEEAEEQAEEARDVACDAKVDAENNAKSLGSFDDRMAAMENDSYRRFDTVMTRCHHVETRQGGTAVQVTRLEQRQRFALWSLAVMATVQVFAAIVRLARR